MKDFASNWRVKQHKHWKEPFCLKYHFTPNPPAHFSTLFDDDIEWLCFFVRHYSTLRDIAFIFHLVCPDRCLRTWMRFGGKFKIFAALSPSFPVIDDINQGEVAGIYSNIGFGEENYHLVGGLRIPYGNVALMFTYVHKMNINAILSTESKQFSVFVHCQL